MLQNGMLVATPAITNRIVVLNNSIGLFLVCTKSVF